ncbi:MAG: hypothetical protein N2248_01855 [candidate division WOR-3 bacterium]|nr:hypothetical protein [candidate division WOR-3 bacterium]
MGVAMRKWVEAGVGIGLLLTGVFIARMRISESEPQFAPISNSVVAVDPVRGKGWCYYKSGIAGVRLFGEN